MNTWAEARDAYIAAVGYMEIPDDAQVFFDMLRGGALDAAVDWSQVVIPE